MYIPNQMQQTLHQDIVNDGLRRSQRRRMLRQRETDRGTTVRAQNLGTPLTALVRSLLGVVARP